MTTAKKIMVGIPFNSGMSARFHLSVTNLTHTLSRDGYSVDINYEEGSLLSTQRNKLARAALDGGFDLLFIDSDMVFSVNDAVRLLESDKDIIGGLYYGRRAPYMPLVFGEDLTEEKYVFRSVKDTNIPDKPFLCKGLGTGFLLIRNAALEKVWAIENDRPFNFMALPNGDQYGEDLSFFRRCNQLGLEIWCDPRGDIGHIAERIIYRHHHMMHVRRDYHYCNDLPGWMTVREQNWLYEKAKEMDSIVEVGCWKGKATHALCSGCKGMVTAVDHFQGSEGERETYHKDSENAYNEFMKNVGNRFSNLNIVVGESLKTADAMKKLNFDMAFIDAGHKYDEVTADLNAWNRLATNLICGHDYTNMGEVQKAVNDFFGQKAIRTYDSIWYVEK